MSKAFTEWKVLPHEPVVEVAENLWTVVGSLPGMPLKRVFSIARMSDGRLCLHNGIALGESSMKQIENHGEPAFLIVPNGYHRLDAPAFKARYPGLKVICPSGAKEKVAEVVEVNGTYTDFPTDDAVKLYHLEGINDAEGVMEVRSADGVTLVFNDAIFNMEHQKGIHGLVFRVLGSTGGPRTSRLFKLLVLKDKRAFKEHLLRLSEIPKLKRIIVSHGAPITDAPSEVLKQVAQKV